MLAAFSLGNQSSIWLVCLLLISAAFLLWLGYRRNFLSTPLKFLAGSLKILGIALFTICLVDPLWSSSQTVPGENLFLILVDNSRSMNLKDDDESSRADSVRSILLTQMAWQTRLSQDFHVRRYEFDRTLRRVTDFKTSTFQGTQSDLKRALSTLKKRIGQQPVAGVLLFSDGNATDLSNATFQSNDLPPIYPVRFPRNSQIADLAVGSIQIKTSAFEDAPVTILAEAHALELSGKRIVAKLFDRKNRLVERQTSNVASKDETLTFRFQFRPLEKGLKFYRFEVIAVETGSIEPSVEESSVIEEATLENNQRTFTLKHGGEKKRILYLSGRPNWEFKFLNRAMADDTEIELAALIRIAKKEPKFEFRGRKDESSNPLFRGFKKEADDQTEKYDQAVILRLNMKDGEELRNGFPQKPEELFGFHAVILDDIETGFFTQEQSQLLEKFVSERGGSLLVLGGLESFRRNRSQFVFERLLPVYLDDAQLPMKHSNYHLLLTRAGWLKPWVRLRKTENEEQVRLSKMPAFRTLNRVRDIKPAAMVLAEVADSHRNKFPALVVQQYGKGKSAALLVGDFWRWGLKKDLDDRDLAKAWRQMLRWLVADTPQQIETQLTHEKNDDTDRMKISVRVRDPAHRLLDNAKVRIALATPDGKTIVLDGKEKATQEQGLYEVGFTPRTVGVYRVAVSAADEQGKLLGESQTGWVHEPNRQEFATVRPNDELLQSLATQTGGEVVPAADLQEFVASLPSRPAPVTQIAMHPLWHQPWLMLFALGCLISEWGIRRWKGMP